MTIEHIYSQCCSTARVLLRDIEAGDLPQVEQGLNLLRRNLAERQSRHPAQARGETLLQFEQIEAIDGVVTEMTGAIRQWKEAQQRQQEQLSIAGNLLQHLTAQPA